jgi:hypothetical protein
MPANSELSNEWSSLNDNPQTPFPLPPYQRGAGGLYKGGWAGGCGGPKGVVQRGAGGLGVGRKRKSLGKEKRLFVIECGLSVASSCWFGGLTPEHRRQGRQVAFLPY